MIEFQKVSYNQYKKDNNNLECRQEWENIRLPKRKTIESAGFDFHSPFDFTLKPNETILIPTAIRISLKPDNWIAKKIMELLNIGLWLAIIPRSGLGFKYKMVLNNTIGCIDADYIDALNEGHIMAKITNDSNEKKTITIKKGEAFLQGIILPYCKIKKDNVIDKRIGGFGSTNQ